MRSVFAPLGPNPAPLVELLWKLHADGTPADLAHVVVDDEASHWLDVEVLATGAALDQLRAVTGTNVRIVVHEVRLDGGGLAADDADPAAFSAYVERMWQAARQATDHADEAVFGLCAGRRRTTTALTTALFELLARADDRCVDVRVSKRSAEGRSGFMFPEQSEATVTVRGRTFQAQDVRVDLVEVRLPRLRGLLRDEDLQSYASALAATDRALQAHRHPEVVVDLGRGEVTIDGRRVKFTAREFLWFATLVHALLTGRSPVPSGDALLLHEVVMRCHHEAWFPDDDATIVRVRNRADAQVPDVDLRECLSTLRSDAKQRVMAFCAIHHVAEPERIVPANKKVGAAWASHVAMNPAHVRWRDPR